MLVVLYKYIIGAHKYIIGAHKFIVGAHKFIVGAHKFIVGAHKSIHCLLPLRGWMDKYSRPNPRRKLKASPVHSTDSLTT
jgi:hypothetical protein